MRKFFLTLLGILYSAPVFAVAWNDPLGGSNVTVQGAAGGLIRSAIGYVGVLGLLGFLYGGFQWMTAGGEAKKVSDAKQTMIWTVVGMLSVFAAYVAVNFVINALTGATGA
jgi:hypothetical protein